MANLRTLRPALFDLTKHEQLELHEEIRVSRKVAKTAPKKKAQAKNKATNNINKMVSKLTPEQAAELLERLQKEGRI